MVFILNIIIDVRLLYLLTYYYKSMYILFTCRSLDFNKLNYYVI